MRLGTRLLAGLLLAGFGIALGTLLLEAAVRAMHLVPARFWQADPLLGRRLIANQEGWWSQEDHEFKVRSRINADGRRDVDRPVVKPPGVFRILILGDSFIEALQVPLEASLGRQLEARLGGAGAPIEVLTMGVSGYGTAGQLLYYRELGRRYRPDLVLVAFYPGNDVMNNSETLEAGLPPVYEADGELQRISDAKSRKEHVQRRRGWLARSDAYRYFRKVILTQQPQLAAWLVRAGLLKREALHSVPTVGGVPADYWVYAANPPPEWQAAWGRTLSLLDQLERIVRQDGARLAIMIVTAREQVYPSTWQKVLEENPVMATTEWDLDGPVRRVETWCRDEGVPCLNLLPAFKGAARDGSTLHFRYDGHWTGAGHALAADSAVAFLRRRNLVPEQRRVGQ